MGPSIGIDGEQFTWTRRRQRRCRLQWGRRLASTERRRSCRPAGAGAPRFNGAVDWHRRRGRGVAPPRGAARSFNGAVDWHRRRATTTPSTASTATRLQWGRRLASTESARCTSGARESARCFNGAVDWHRRRGGATCPARRSSRGFNGAVDWHRRREERLIHQQFRGLQPSVASGWALPMRDDAEPIEAQGQYRDKTTS